ncbi:MAG: hypothetical protein JWL90_2636, partial [Chthoniobacteraceae bacterium]|nr:hypothetical protein [Chthoniobacteraceae bacterium]
MKPFSLVVALVVAVSFPCPGAPPKTTTLSKPEEPAAAPVWKRLNAEVTTPLFIKQAAGINTLANVTLSATAIPLKGEVATVVFTSDLGAGGNAVIAAVTKLLKSVHHGWPAGHRVEIAFNPPVAPDDAPASALAIALILDSMIAGWEADPACSIVGGLRDDGKVFAATSALMRLTTATRSAASRIIMPEKNATEAADCMVNEGVAGTGRVQMFAVKDFDEVLRMAAATPDPDMTTAMETFAEVQKSLSQADSDPEALLKESDVLESL